ncbi:class I SAM-dependent methyltransferase [Salegentibacter sp. F188]|uniref:Class I SAM-dependent methyltransferase n=1 Tax=Autumnicola patrickiae TaxID=3075591 RepID=A0ABU3DY22_9FLAO|nr:class I SAM-dependent methyltransferase [Salegentibacter sp. F188]MDT0688608.1 class I SAM-dependent methyltransferase [Salegentibacter sp. F188]
MIRKLKNKIKEIVDIRFRLLRDQQHQNHQDLLYHHQVLFNHSQLKQLFHEDSFISFSAWAISPSTILHVLNDITINNRKYIIELGSGASTFYIAKLLKVLNSDAIFYTVESDEKWAKELKRQLQLYDIFDRVNIIIAPLVEVPNNYSFREQDTWYDTQVLEDNLTSKEEIDLVLVDGPFGGSTPYARYSAIPFLKSRIAREASIFLDDVQRPDEAEILKEWEKVLKRTSKIHERYGFFTSQRTFDVSPFQI